ncbi:MAG: LCP family protein [Anaerolineales bacterium]|jgi:LCP family protein required for cell wall assembly|nr:LCP family protein [Anaerolineales bacterium]
MHNPPDPLGETTPSRAAASLGRFQAIRLRRDGKKLPNKFNWGWGCGVASLLPVLAFLLYLFAPVRSNILILGVDGGLDRGDLGRTDTIILATISPLAPKVGMLSIPRDLWVTQADGNENRINTAFFFAEAEQPGSGPKATERVIYQNFGVPAQYSIVLRMDGVVGMVDALGGIEIALDSPSAGYAPGSHRLNGTQALAFARNRSSADDFGRMLQAQILLGGIMREMLKPGVWTRLPAFFSALQTAAQIDIPVWLWPRLGLAFLRAGPGGIDSRVISREMVTPFTTSGGAQVLGPNWEKINPVLEELFR